MATVDDGFLLRLLEACATSSPLYPARFAKEQNLDRDQLDAGLDELRRRGLVQFTVWVRDGGQGYALTETGREALATGRLPSERAIARAETRPEASINPYQRGETVRSGILSPGRPYACWALLAVNILFFAYGAAYSLIHHRSVADYVKGEDPEVLGELGGLWTPATIPKAEWKGVKPEPSRLALSLFLHAGLLHLFVNMYFLVTMAGEIEALWGSVRFLVIYFVAGLVSGCVVILIDRFEERYPVTVGASGPLYGVFTAMIVWFFLNRRHLPEELFRDWSRTISMSLVLLIGSNFLPNVSWQGHLGGAVGGALAALVLQVQRFNPSPLVRWLAIAGIPLIPAAFFLAVLWQAGWI
jgi:membrane associated rhomboid family serine protease